MDRKLLARFGIEIPEIMIGYQVLHADGTIALDKDGKPRSVYRESRTVNHNFYTWAITNGMLVDCVGSSWAVGSLNVKDTGGTVRTGSAISTIVYQTVEVVAKLFYADVGVVTYGLVIGTGTGAEDFEGYSLDSRIPHSAGGSEAGKMYYASTEAPVKVWNAVDNRRETSWSRQFTNNSGNTIDVAECGVYVDIYTSTSYYIMTMRDLISPAESVPDGDIFRLTYTFRTSFSG